MFHFVLKHEWFEKIAIGEKRTEFRQCKPFWNKTVYRELNKAGAMADYEKGKFLKIPCRFYDAYFKGRKTLDGFVTKIDIEHGLKTDLEVNGAVYAFDFELNGE